MTEPRQGEFQNKSDVELFNLMKSAGRSTSAARAAFGEFFRRYANDVKRHVLKMYSNVVKCEADLEDFVQLVFIRFWKYGLRVFDASVARTPEELPKLVHHWLAGAALRVFQNQADKQKTSPNPQTGVKLLERATGGAVSILALLASREAIAEKSELDWRLADGLEKLGQRERDVLLSCYRYYDEERKECRVEKDIQVAMCKELGFNNWAAVRKCKERAEKKLWEALLNQAQVA